MSSENKQRIVYVLTRTNKVDDDDTDIYVGSTSLSLEQRLRCHRAEALNLKRNSNIYTRMRTVGIQNWEIIPLLSRTCDLKTIRQLERKWCKIMNADLNTYLPITTPEEKKQQKADCDANYYKVNKNAIKQQRFDYRNANKQGKRYYCDICKYVAESNKDLKKHFKTAKHFWNYIYSVD